LGELYSFLCAVIWAIAVILFKKAGETIRPISLNLYKNIISMVCIYLMMLAMGEKMFLSASPKEYFLLVLSGILGIGISDTFFFKSLNLLGAGFSSIVDCFYSPMIITLSFLFLGERLTTIDFVGAILIIAAILVASFKPEKHKLSKKELILGIILGILAMFSVAVSVILIKPILNTSPLFWLTEIRLMAGTISLLFLGLILGNRKNLLTPFYPSKTWKYMFPASFLGGFLGMVVWMAGMKYTTASLASILNQTSTIFITVFAVMFLKEKLTLNRIIGLILAMLGAILVTI
jgi:drug/metabolite transporter (DMT)-like permease